MRRRDFLASVGAGTAGLAVACGQEGDTAVAGGPGRAPFPSAPWSGVGAEDAAAFPLAVQAGDPTADGAVLWTRYLGGAPLEVVIAAFVDGAWVEVEALPATVEDGGFVHLELTGRDPDQSVAFQFRDADGALSAVGVFRTALADGAAAVVVLGASSCYDQSHLDFPSLARAVERGPVDLFCHLGDTIYGDGLSTPDGFRELWALNQSTAGLRAVMVAAAQAFTWDDHEVSNNWTDDGYPEGALEAGRQVFFESTPTRRDPEHPDRIWRRLQMGATAEVFVLDCRGERDPGAGVYVSEEQLAWLIDGVTQSAATWKVILNSVPVADLPEVLDPGALLADRWEGYPAQRDALLAGLGGVSGVLFVSGDLHFGCVTRVMPDGPLRSVFEVLTGPGGSFLNAVMLLVDEDDAFLWRDAVWSATRLELYPEGLARITFVGELDETWLEVLVDAAGEVLAVDARHSADALEG